MVSTSIIILNWNGYEDTRRCLSSLYACEDKDMFDIIVIDNGSIEQEGTWLQREYPFIDLITNPSNVGFAAAVNQGILYAKNLGYKFVVILNNDVETKETFFIPLYHSINRNLNSVAASVVLQQNSDRVQNIGAKLSFGLGLGIHIAKGKLFKKIKNPPKVDYLPFVCLAAPIRAFQEVGLLDECYFAYYEDADWCIRARKAGWNLNIVLKSQVVHKVSSSTSKGSKMGSLKAYLMARNFIYFTRKHYNLTTRLILYSANFHFRMIWGMQTCADTSVRLAWLRGVCDGFRGNMCSVKNFV